MSIKTFAGAICGILLLNSTQVSAAVIFYTDLAAFNADTNTSIIGFEDIVFDNQSLVGEAHIIDDIKFTTNTASDTVSDAVICGKDVCSGRPHDSAFFLASNTSGAPADIVIDLTTAGLPPVTAAGGIFGDVNGDDTGTNGTVTLNLYGLLGIIDTQDVIYGDMRLGKPKTFFGWATTNGEEITKVELITNGIAFSALDDFQYGTVVPVPAAVWLFGSGLLALIGFARRKS